MKNHQGAIHTRPRAFRVPIWTSKVQKYQDGQLGLMKSRLSSPAGGCESTRNLTVPRTQTTRLAALLAALERLTLRYMPTKQAAQPLLPAAMNLRMTSY